MKTKLKSALLAGICSMVPFGIALGGTFDIPSGDLQAALKAYSAQSGIPVVVSDATIKGVRTKGLKGELPAEEALSRILKGTGFRPSRDPSGVIAIVPGMSSSDATDVQLQPLQLAQAAQPRAAVETVTVTSSKLGGADVQSIPIAITALSQEQLTTTQTAGGPDLVKNVPNLTFSKTNFTGYNIQIRGIGTQAISVTTDPAVAVALNDIPFIRNHFFEQEFYDLSQAEVLRGPQGTLYGRNATAGVVNLSTAKPTDQFEAMASADIGNYKNRRFEGMMNVPIIDDRLDLRVAGEWTKRDGYTTNAVTGSQVDGRNLWSGRVTLSWKPLQNLQTYLVWEHFQENDDRMRTAKQLCKRDGGPETVLGATVIDPQTVGGFEYLAFGVHRGYLSQGCLPTSLYSSDAFQVPYGYSLPYVEAGYAGTPIQFSGGLDSQVDPYAHTTQSTNLRVIETEIDPHYKAKNDTVEMNADYTLAPALTFTSQTGYNNDFLWSTEDYNRFDTSPDIFLALECFGGDPTCGGDVRDTSVIIPDGNYRCFDQSIAIGHTCTGGGFGGRPTGYFCDPQLGCSNRLIVQDLSEEHAWQLSQEFRLASNYSGPLNFSMGGNYMHYETEENYYVFSNAFTLVAATSAASHFSAWVPNVSDNHECLSRNAPGGHGIQYHDPADGAGLPSQGCYYIDPNPLESVNNLGANYFVSQNPYTLNSYAGFGEAYYNVASDLKLTGGLRWTSDHKHFVDIPSELLAYGYGYLSTGAVDQSWEQFTGRFAANWTPQLTFTDQTLVYASYAHGYKAGGANPPGPALSDYQAAGGHGVPIHPLTFKPEFVDAFELGSKNTMLDGGLTFNGDVFYYNYKAYQISRIVDRTSINDNFDATVRGAEIEASYEPVPGLKFHFAGGYEDTRIDNGQSSIDLMDRTAGHPGWMVMKPFVSEPSNCIFPDYVVHALITEPSLAPASLGNYAVDACAYAYNQHRDPAYVPTSGGPSPYTPGEHEYLLDGTYYTGYDPLAGTAGDPYTGQNTYNGVDYGPVPNNGQGFAKDLSGHELPNAPHFTVSLSAEYSLPISEDWAGTLHGDYYWQDYSWARVFNDNPYDRIRGYTNVNLALILSNQNGWQVMGYVKNVFDTTAITGTFLNSDDSGLTTNVFLTDPRLFGVRVTKNW